MTKTKIINFCDKNDIAWRPIKLEITSKDGKITKIPLPVGGSIPKVNDFKNDEYLSGQMKKHQKNFKKADTATKDNFHIAVDTNNIYQLDIDWLPHKKYSEEAKILVKKFLDLCPYYKSTTKELGKHILFKLNEPLIKDNTKFINKTLYEDLEVLSGSWGWSKWDEMIINSHLEIPTLNIEDFPFDNVVHTNKKKLIVKSKSPKSDIFNSLDDTIKKSLIFRYCDIIDIKYLDDYSDWIRILWSLKTENHYKIAKYISRKSKKYNEFTFNSKWEGLKPTTITIGSVLYYAQISDIKKYRKIQLEGLDEWEQDFLDSDDTQAKIFLKNNEANLVYWKNNLYIFEGDIDGTNGRWHADEKYERTKNCVSEYLSKLIVDFLLVLRLQHKEEKDEDLKDEITKRIKATGGLCKMLKNVSKINSIMERLKQLLSVRDYSEVEFDTNGLLFPFNNTCYDLKTHNWIGTRRDNYILNTSGYNWIDPTDEEVDTLTNIIDDIFPDESVKQEYIHYLATCLYGIPIEKFIIANGDGGNGKGVINELVMDTCGDFGYQASNSVLLNPIKDGGNPAIANMNKKRLICYREPDEKKSINLSAVKELTGGKSITARKLYSNEDSVMLVGTHILECNKKCQMTGNLDNSIHRRIRDIPFVATYTHDESQLKMADDLNFIRKADPYFKTAGFQKKYKYAMFKFLLIYAKKWESENDGKNVCEKLYKSDLVDTRTKHYIEENDNIYSILKQHYVRQDAVEGQEKPYIKIREFLYYFKDSEFYKTLSKHEQNKVYSEKCVIDHLKSTTSTKIYYKERYMIKNNIGVAYNAKNILLFWRAKTNKEIMEEQQEDEELLFMDE